MSILSFLDFLEGGQDIDWWALLENKTEFVISEVIDADTKNYTEMNVESIEPGTDDEGNATEVVNCSALDMNRLPL